MAFSSFYFEQNAEKLIYIKTSFAFKGHWKSQVEKQNEEIELIYAFTSHCNLLYKINSRFKNENEEEKKY